MKSVQIVDNGRKAVFSDCEDKAVDYTKMEVDMRLAKETDERIIKLLKWAKSHMVY